MTTQRAARIARSKATWEMTDEELAITFADVEGYEGREGGWIYSPAGRPVAHGWAAFARVLRRRGVIVPGVGINWRAGVTNARRIAR